MMQGKYIGILILALVITVLLLGCGDAALETLPGAMLAGVSEPGPEATDPLDDLVETRIPEPTATPRRTAREVERIAERAGLSRTPILGLTIAGWTSLAIALLAAAFAYLASTLVVRRVLPPLVLRTTSDVDDQLLAQTGSHLRWLVVVIILDLVLQPLSFLSAGLKQFLGDTLFVLALAIGVHGTWKAITVVAHWYRKLARRAGRARVLAPVIILLARLARALLVATGLIVLLSHFGINVTALAAALGLGGLAISLAARDTIADAISGLIILLDQPFRIGDRIEVEEVGTWGEVVDIGLRTTRIRTWLNHDVIVPNSHIGQSQVINYSHPDSRCLIVQPVGVAYGTEVETARQLIIDTVQQVPGVLPGTPVRAH